LIPSTWHDLSGLEVFVSVFLRRKRVEDTGRVPIDREKEEKRSSGEGDISCGCWYVCVFDVGSYGTRKKGRRERVCTRTKDKM
jgi:hypothetical protein